MMNVGINVAWVHICEILRHLSVPLLIIRLVYIPRVVKCRPTRCFLFVSWECTFVFTDLSFSSLQTTFKHLSLTIYFQQ